MIGETLGSYRITAKLGSGGMGEVYRARDIRLARDVALKVLPEGLASDEDRLARFRREAQLLAALNHTNIAAIYGLEESGKTTALILELVEGPTLADEIRRGPMPLDRVLHLAKQIAEALEAAHEKGIVHRDLKPANIKITEDDKVKVLDFGLAKVFSNEASNSLSDSPTMTSAPSMAGMILGTASYMSPEQAQGKPVDRRTDIWSFGVVLFECLTGERAFKGENLTEVLGSILHEEPDWRKIPAGSSAPVVRFLRRCLAKNVRQRLHDIADARLEIEGLLQEPSGGPAVLGNGQGKSVKRVVGATLALFASMIAGGVLMRGWDRGMSSPAQQNVDTRPLLNTVVDLPADAPFAIGFNAGSAGFEPTVLSLSPLGTEAAYVGRSGTGTMLYLVNLASAEIRPLSGTEDAVQAFFSPDGKWVGFLTNDKLKKVDTRGGAPITLSAARTAVQGWWVQNEIYISESQGRQLTRVSSEGGQTTVLLSQDSIASEPAWRRSFNDVLPDGKNALVTAKRHGISDDYSEIEVVSLETHQAKTVARAGYGARYVSPGYLLFARAGRLLAAHFDLKREELLDEPVPVAADVSMESLFGQVDASASNNGILAFVAGGDRTVGKLAWVDRKGVVEFLQTPSRVYGVLSLSHDGKRVAVHVADVSDYIWIYDLTRGEGKRLSGTESRGWPIWSTGDMRLAFSSIVRGKLDLVSQDVNEGASPKIIASGLEGYPTTWLPDEKVLFVNSTGGGRFVHSDGTTGPLEPDVTLSTFSGDGRWIFYVSPQTGQNEIWVRSYPDGKGARQVSIDGGIEPRWCSCGELFYRKANQWFSTKVSLTPELRLDSPRLVFDTDFIDTPGTSYDVSPDGKRLLIVKRSAPPVRQQIHIVVNWSKVVGRKAE
jgi:eukaryotic-like serine/threonine-protein kinase